MHPLSTHTRVGWKLVTMSAPRPFLGARLVPARSLGSAEEVGGWGSRLTKWQWALAIGLPVAAAAAVAGLTLFISRRRSRARSAREGSPPPSMSPTPVASPTPTTARKTESSGKVTVSGVFQLKSTGPSTTVQCNVNAHPC